MIYLGAVHPSNTIDIIDSVNQQCVQLYLGIIASVSLGLQHICTSPHTIEKGDLIILSLIYILNQLHQTERRVHGVKANQPVYQIRYHL